MNEGVQRHAAAEGGAWFGESPSAGLADFGAAYLERYDAIAADALHALRDGRDVEAALARAGTDAISAHVGQLRVLFQAGMEGDWRPFECEVAAIAGMCAETDVPFEVWFAATAPLRRHLTGQLVPAVAADRERVVGAIDAMQEFVDRVLVTASQTYREVAARALRNQQQLAARQAIERAAWEASLRASEIRFARLYESGVIGILICDLVGNIKEANDGFLTMVGYSREELLSGHIRWSEMTPPEWKHLDDEAVERLKRTGFTRTWEKEYFRKDGSRVPILVGVAMLNDTECIAFALDITERRRLEELRAKSVELENQNRRIQEANRLKSEFLANMSHELRTPLNSIIGFAELLHDGEVAADSPQHAEFIADILTSGRHLLQLINDVLDLAKVEAGKIAFHPEAVQLDHLVREVVAILRGVSSAKSIQVDVEIDSRANDVATDPARLKQVLYNYLSNALKFTPEGGFVFVRARPESGDAFRLEVVDTGIGIAAEDLGRLFVEFQQLNAGVAKRHAGTGLGLALTKRIVEAQGGSVGVKSALGSGSTFFAILPRSSQLIEPSDVGASLSPARPGALSILVVEDDPRDLLLIARTLSGAGYGVETATTGAVAVHRCSAHKFDAITLDLLLADMTGLDVLHRIRLDGKNRETPVVVVSVVAEKGVVGGFSVHDYLCKPVNGRDIVASLERAGLAATRLGDVMVIEDEPASLRLMEAALSQLGYAVDGRPDGESALAALHVSPPHAIVLDLMLPGMDGFEFLARLRQIPACRETPVVVWTMKDLTADDLRQLRARAQAVLRKGEISSRSLVDELRSTLERLRNAVASTSRQAP